MSKKYNLTSNSVILRALLFLAPTLFTSKILTMDIGKETIKDITYFNEEERAVRLEKIENLNNTHTLNFLCKEIFSIDNVIKYTLSHNDRFVFIQHNDNTAELINTEDGLPIGKPFTNILDYAFSNNDKFLFIQKNGKIVELISTEDGLRIGNPFRDAMICGFSNNNRFLKIIHYDYCTSELINTEDGTSLTNSSRNNLSNNDKFLFITHHRLNSAKLINTENGNQIIKQFKDVSDNSFSHNNKFLFIQYKDNTSELINTEDGLQIGKLFTNVLNGNFSYDDKFILIKHNDGTSERINTENGSFFTNDNASEIINSKDDARIINYIKDKDVCHHTLSYDGKLLIIHYKNKGSELFDLENTESLLKMKRSLKIEETFIIENNFLLFKDQENRLHGLKFFESRKQFIKKLNGIRKLIENKDRKNCFCDTTIHTHD